MTNPQTWFCQIDLRKLTPTLQSTDVSFFIYVVAYQPSSCKEL